MKGTRALTQSEVKAILKNAEPREQVLFLTGLYFGTRVSESLALTFADVSGKYLYLKSKKGSDNQAYPIPDEYKAALAALRSEYAVQGKKITPESPLILSRNGANKSITRQQASQILTALCERLGIEGKVNTHSLRKCFVTKIYEMTGKDIVKTQNYSRHKNLSNLQYYIATTNDTSLVSSMAW